VAKQPVVWTFLTEDELPKGPNGETYRSQGEYLKAFRNQVDLISRQQEFIRGRLATGQGTPELQAALEKTTRELEELKRQASRQPQQQAVAAAPAPAQPHQQASGQGTQASITATQAKLVDLGRQLDEIEASDDPFSDENVKRTRQLQRAQLAAMNDQATLLAKAQQDVLDTRKEVSTLQSTTRAQRDQEENARKQREAQEALQADMRTMESFAGGNPEFAVSKPMEQIDREYAEWGRQVARAQLGREPRNNQEIGEALRQLELKSPTLVNTCMLAGIPIEPTKDMRAYLQICDLMDYRDGYRRNPTTGAMEQVFTVDPRTGQRTVDRFPAGIEGLKAAYAYRKDNDGVYATAIAQARRDGGTAALQAAQRRDLGAVEAGREAGMGGIGGASGVAEIAAKRDAIDEERAILLARSGDTSLLDQYNRLTTALGNSAVEIPGYRFNG